MDKEKQEEVLKYLLGRIYRADKHKNQLDARLKNIAERRQMENLPAEDEPTSIRYWISDIECRILDQKKEIDQAIAQVMDIIDYLPINSIERQICELRHIDFKPWGAISAEIPMSRSQVNRRYKAAVKFLLKNQRIQSIAAEHEDEYDTYVHGKWAKKKVGIQARKTSSEKNLEKDQGENKAGHLFFSGCFQKGSG
jgi:hypothetical protein